MKLCKLCLNKKEITEFYTHPGTKDWHLSFCKDCKRSYAKTNRSKESDKIRYRTNPKRRLWTIYRWIQGRCYDKNNNHYKRYWNRWIICERNNYSEFMNDMFDSFIASIEKYGANDTTIERIDNDGNYCKSNCTWTTKRNQANNRSDNRIIEYNGESNTLANMCRKYNMNYKLVHGRLKKWWSIEKSLSL